MSGHSKWSTIKRQKGATDAKRGQLFTKLAKAITLAVKQGGGNGDPSLNFRLRLVIETARAANMPKENIERAIARAHGSSADEMQEVVYEGFGPGGFSIIVEAITDNKLRTNAEVKNIFEKNGGSFGSPGSVAYQFEKKGIVTVKKNGKDFDDVMLYAADAGAEDVEDAGENILIYTKSDGLAHVRDEMVKKGYAVEEAKLIRAPLTMLLLTDREASQRAMRFTSLFEDHQDVQDVFTNADIPDTFLVVE